MGGNDDQDGLIARVRRTATRRYGHGIALLHRGHPGVYRIKIVLHGFLLSVVRAAGKVSLRELLRLPARQARQCRTSTGYSEPVCANLGEQGVLAAGAGGVGAGSGGDVEAVLAAPFRGHSRQPRVQRKGRGCGEGAPREGISTRPQRKCYPLLLQSPLTRGVGHVPTGSGKGSSTPKPCSPRRQSHYDCAWTRDCNSEVCKRRHSTCACEASPWLVRHVCSGNSRDGLGGGGAEGATGSRWRKHCGRNMRCRGEGRGQGTQHTNATRLALHQPTSRLCYVALLRYSCLLPHYWTCFVMSCMLCNT